MAPYVIGTILIVSSLYALLHFYTRSKNTISVIESFSGTKLDRFEAALEFYDLKSVDLRKDEQKGYTNPRTRDAFDSFVDAPEWKRGDKDFILSLASGCVTQSALVGYVVGGSVVGGLIGSSLGNIDYGTDYEDTTDSYCSSDSLFEVTTDSFCFSDSLF
jgi:hypothetical protein